MGSKPRTNSGSSVLSRYWPLSRVVRLVEAPPESVAKAISKYYRRKSVTPSNAHLVSVEETMLPSTLDAAFETLLPLTRSERRWIILRTTKHGWCAVFANTAERSPNFATRLSRTGLLHVVECDGRLANPNAYSFFWSTMKNGRSYRSFCSARGKVLWSNAKQLPFEEPPMTKETFSDKLFLDNMARGGFYPHEDSFYLQTQSSPGIGLSCIGLQSFFQTTQLSSARKRRLKRTSVF